MSSHPVSPRRKHPARATRHRRARDRARHAGPAQRRARDGPVHAALRGGHRRPRGPSRGRRLLERHGGAPPRGPGPRDRRGRRGHHDALQLRRLGELPALRACRPALRRHRGGQPRARSRTSWTAAASPRTRAVLPVHVFGRPCRIDADPGDRAATGAGPSSRTPARASARPSTGGRWAASATSPSSPSTRTSRSRPARAAWSSPTTRRSPRPCAASATRGATPTGPGCDTCASGTTTGSTRCRPPSGWRSWSGSPSCGPGATGSSRPTSGRSAARTGCGCRAPEPARPSTGSCTSSGSTRRSIATALIGRLAEVGVPSRPVLHAAAPPAVLPLDVRVRAGRLPGHRARRGVDAGPPVLEPARGRGRPLRGRCPARGRRMTPAARTPAVVVSGHTMALAVVRSLGEAGVPVAVMHYDARDIAQASRYVVADVTRPQSARRRGALRRRAGRRRAGGSTARSSSRHPTRAAVAVSRHKSRLQERYVVAAPGVGGHGAVHRQVEDRRPGGCQRDPRSEDAWCRGARRTSTRWPPRSAARCC